MDDGARTLCTPWGETIPDLPHSEHPDPMRRTPEWMCLNGWWDWAITKACDAPVEEQPAPTSWQGRIRVPFAVESAASGVAKALLPGQVLHYRRTVCVPDDWRGRGLRLVVGAADQEAALWVNGSLRVVNHDGYHSFEALISPEETGGDLEIRLSVTDPTDTGRHQYGKQSLHPRTIWYTATSGIWKSVWMEPVGLTRIQGVSTCTTSRHDALEFTVTVEQVGPALVHDEEVPQVHIDVELPDGTVSTVEGPAGRVLRAPLADPRPWSPEDPHLYPVTVRAGDATLHTFAALRSVGMSAPAHGHILLNGRPVLVNAPLHQGYWPESGMTPPSDQALVADLQMLKDLGFNAVRCHIKIESPRFYHHCDRLGLMVVQDMVSGGKPPLGIRASGAVQATDITCPDRSRAFAWWTGRQDPASKRRFLAHVRTTVERLQEHPSIIAWVPFNEAWGQFDSRRLEAGLRRLDPTRLVDAASGWFDQGGGDFRSRHRYVLELVPPPRWDQRPLYLSEFGGLNMAVPDHLWDPESAYGYRFLPDRESLAEALADLYRRQLIPLVGKGLVACTYTQVSDVEKETNGFVTYDRRVLKVDPELMRALNGELAQAFISHLQQS